MSGTRARRLAAGLGLSLLVLVLIEGASSGLWFGWEAWTRFERPIQERHHTRYDSELGWVNEPGMSDPDLYAPGRGITTNSQGFRNTRHFPVEVPAGRLRVICAGDSFTLGYGVADSDSWPAQLAALDPRLETVNMGQGGYGVDQAWMWYRRDGLELDHQLLLFAFIGDDFERMRKATFRGYGKPLLKVVDGRIAVGNVPVPRSSFRFPLLTQNLPLLEELRIVELGRRVLRKLRGGEPAARRLDLDERQARELLRQAIRRENIGQSDTAMRLYSRIVAEFPQALAAKKAKINLQEIQGEQSAESHVIAEDLELLQMMQQ